MVGLNISGTMKQYMDVLSNPSEAVLEYGMFDGVRVDGGKEFFLVFGMQVELQDLRGNSSILPYMKTESKQVYFDFISSEQKFSRCKVYREYVVRKAVKYA